MASPAIRHKIHKKTGTETVGFVLLKEIAASKLLQII